MQNYSIIILCLALAEVLRRLVLAVVFGFTGPLSKIPGPFIFKFTSLPWIIQSAMGKHINTAEQLFHRYGDIVRVAPRTVLVADKDSIHKILVEEDLPKPPSLDNMRLHPGNAMLITERDKLYHKNVRRLLSPGFSVSYLNGLEPLMKECIEEFEIYLDRECEKGNGFAIIDMQGILSSLSFDVMSATSLGGSFNLVRSNDTKLQKIFTNSLVRGLINGTLPFLKYIPFWPPVVSPEMNKILDAVLDRRGTRGKPAKRDLVQIIIEAHEADPVAFPEMRMRDEITLLMVAGGETTSASTTSVLLLLVNNTEKLERLTKEIDSALPSMDDDVTFAKLQDLPYLNAVIWESLRLMSSLPGLQRYSIETTFISGFEIPPETTVHPWPMVMMKSPRIWPDAEKFVPERWLETYKGAEAERGNVLTFSAGSRNCIGQQFAMREMRMILARLLHRFEIILIPGQSTERRYHLTGGFVQGFYNVGVKPRKWWVREVDANTTDI